MKCHRPMFPSKANNSTLDKGDFPPSMSKTPSWGRFGNIIVVAKLAELLRKLPGQSLLVRVRVQGSLPE